MPKSVRPNMKADLREVRDAPDRATAEAAIVIFVDKYETKYSKAVDCLTKDREALLTFFDFPAEHWDHLRTSNPIESVFATVRHRTVRTEGSLLHKTARLMVIKLVVSTAKTWRRLKGENQLPVRQESWRVPVGGSPVRVRGSARPVASVAAWKVTTAAKRTQQSCGVWV